jgi:hypothetical protein
MIFFISGFLSSSISLKTSEFIKNIQAFHNNFDSTYFSAISLLGFS